MSSTCALVAEFVQVQVQVRVDDEAHFYVHHGFFFFFFFNKLLHFLICVWSFYYYDNLCIWNICLIDMLIIK